MEKTIKLRLHASGLWTTITEDGSDELGLQLEKGATKIRVYVPAEIKDLKHYLEFLNPEGDVIWGGPFTLTTDTEDADGKYYFEVTIGDKLTATVGRYKMQYVGRKIADSATTQRVKSRIYNFDVNESIDATFTADEVDVDLEEDLQKDIDDLEKRVVTCETTAKAATTAADTATSTANDAKAKAAEAATSAAGSATSASSAQQSASAAATSASDSATKADSAASSAASAAQSATGSATSAAGAKTSADSAASSAAAAATSAESAIDTANGASATANAAKTASEAAVKQVTELLTAKETLTGPYLQLKNPKAGEDITFHVALVSGSNVSIKVFWGKNFFNVKGLTRSPIDGHMNYAYGPLVVPYAQYLYLTIPDGYRLIVRELDGLAYKSTEGNLIQEDTVETSGIITLNARTVGKSIRIFLTKIVSDAETMPTADDLTALASTTSLSYGTSAIAHADYVSPTIKGPYTYAANGASVDVTVTAVSSTANVAVVPNADAGADCDYANSYVSYLTTDLADQVTANAEKNVEQDKRLSDAEANIAALQSVSGDLVLAVSFTGDEIAGTKLLGNSGQEFDLANNKNTYQTIQWFMGMDYDVQEKALLSDGTEIQDPDTLAAAIMHFVYVGWFCFRMQTSTDSAGVITKTIYFSPTVRSGYTPIGQFSDGTYPRGFLVGKYGTTWLDTSTRLCAGPFPKKPRVMNRNPNQLLALSQAPYIKDTTLGLATPTKVDQWCDAAFFTTWAILEMVVLGSRNAQDTFRGICDDGTYCTTDDATTLALQPTTAGSIIYLPTSNYIVTKLKARYTKKSDYGYITLWNQALSETYWHHLKVTAVTDSTPSSGYTQITLESTYTFTPSTAIRLSLNWGWSGQTSSITTGFGNEDGDGNGYNQCQIFGAEASHGDHWQYEKGFIRKKYASGVYTNKVYIPQFAKVGGADYETSDSDNADSGIKNAVAVDSGWIKEIEFGGRIFYPSALGSSSATAYCDYNWNDKPTMTEGQTTDREILVGGNGSNGSYAGPFSVHGDSGVWWTYWYFGSRCFLWLPAK